MLFYSLTIFLSAFLLFEVQPIIAKMILPWFGGTSAVWSTCMLFFQIVLLLGYLYAHWLNRKLDAAPAGHRPHRVLAVSLAALPILPNPSWKTAGVGHPSLRILALLAVTVGLPYFLLSSTSPLLQAWYARTHKGGCPTGSSRSPTSRRCWRCSAIRSLIEPNLPTRAQALIWSVAYVCFAAVCGLTAWRARPERAGASPEEPARRTRRCRAAWMLASALARAGGQRLRAAAGRDHAPDAGRRRHPVPLDRAAHRLPAELHPLFRGAAVLSARAVFLPLLVAVAGVHGVSPLAGARVTLPLMHCAIAAIDR